MSGGHDDHGHDAHGHDDGHGNGAHEDAHAHEAAAAAVAASGRIRGFLTQPISDRVPVPLWGLLGVAAALAVILFLGINPPQPVSTTFVQPLPGATVNQWDWLVVWGNPIPISRLPLARLAGIVRHPLWGVITTLSFIGVLIALIEAMNPRGNQTRAIRCAWGIVLFGVAAFTPGWLAGLIAFAALWMAIRPRAGGQMKVWPILSVLVLVIVIYFFVFTPFILPRLLVVLTNPWLTWAPRLWSAFFSGTNIRLLVPIVWAGVTLYAAWSSRADATSLAAIGMGYYAANLIFGQWLFLEAVALSSWWDNAIGWIVLGLIGVALISEYWEGGKIAVPIFIGFLALVGLYVAKGVVSDVPELLTQPTRSWQLAAYLVSPAVSTIGFVFLLSLMVSFAASTQRFAGFASQIATFTGPVIKAGPIYLLGDGMIGLAFLWLVLIRLGFSPL